MINFRVCHMEVRLHVFIKPQYQNTFRIRCVSKYSKGILSDSHFQISLKFHLHVILSMAFFSDQFSFCHFRLSVFNFFSFFWQRLISKTLRCNPIYMHKVKLFKIYMNVDNISVNHLSLIDMPVQFFSVVCFEIGQHEVSALCTFFRLWLNLVYMCLHDLCDFAPFILCITSERVNNSHSDKLIDVMLNETRNIFFRGVPVISMFWNACITLNEKIVGSSYFHIN